MIAASPTRRRYLLPRVHLQVLAQAILFRLPKLITIIIIISRFHATWPNRILVLVVI